MWIFIALVIGFVVYRYFSAMQQDSYELESQSLPEKFRVIIDELNASAFKGKGSVTTHDKRSFNLYEDGQNQIIHFQYSTGSLSITWKFKYYQKEIVYEKNFPDSRNLSLFEQKKIAELVISQVSELIRKHKAEVLGVDVTPYQESIIELKSEQKKELIKLLNKQIHMMLEVLVMSWQWHSKLALNEIIDDTEKTTLERLKNRFTGIKLKFEDNNNQIFYFSEVEFENIAKELIKKYIKENFFDS